MHKEHEVNSHDNLLEFSVLVPQADVQHVNGNLTRLT